MATDRIKRLAVYEAWAGRCQWCKKPILYPDMEIDHIIPATAQGVALKELLEMHGLTADYDLQSTRNLICSCGTCNGYKTDRLPPDAPIIRTVLDDTLKRAPIVEKYIADFKKNHKLEKLIAALEAIESDGDLDDDVKLRLHRMANGAANFISLVTGTYPEPAKLHRRIDPHDWQPPLVKEKKLGKRKIRKDEMLDMLDDWADGNIDARDEIGSWFNADDYALDSAGPREVTRIGYAKSVDRYLVSVIFDIDYHTIDEYDEHWDANDIRSFDMWVEMNEDRTKVVDATVDGWDSFG